MAALYFIYVGLALVFAALFIYLAWKEFGPGYEEVPAAHCLWCGKLAPINKNGIPLCKECAGH